MAEDTYKGESDSKKVARMLAWERAVEILGNDRLNTSMHVVLASRIGGDVSVLRSFGVPDKNIIAAERCEVAGRQFAATFPGVCLHIGDVIQAVDKCSERIGAVFLDFCAELCADTWRTCIFVATKMPPGSVMMVALQKGREKPVRSDTSLSGILYNKSTRRRMSLGLPNKKREVDALYKPGGDPRALLNTIRTEHSTSMMRTIESIERDRGTRLTDEDRLLLLNIAKESDDKLRRAARFVELEGGMLSALISGHITYKEIEKRHLALDTVIEYQSSTRHSRGVPMSIGIFCHGGRYTSRGIHKVDSHQCDIRRMVVGGTDPGRLNIPSATAAAWRAHATRGTYGVAS